MSDAPRKETITTKNGRTFTRIVVDRELCIGAASCIAVASDAFELDEEAKAVVKETWSKYDDATLKAAAESCPTLAIFLYTGDTKVYPAEA